MMLHVSLFTLLYALSTVCSSGYPRQSIHHCAIKDANHFAGNILPAIRDSYLIRILLCPNPQELPSYILFRSVYALVTNQRQELHAKRYDMPESDMADCQRLTKDMASGVIRGVGGLPARLIEEVIDRNASSIMNSGSHLGEM